MSVHGIIVPGWQQNRHPAGLAPGAQFLFQLCRQRIVQGGHVTTGARHPAIGRRRRWLRGRLSLPIASDAAAAVRLGLGLQSRFDVVEFLLVLRSVDQHSQLCGQQSGRLHGVAPIDVHVDGPLGDGVVEEQDHGHQVLVLVDAGHRVIGDQVLDQVAFRTLTTRQRDQR